MERDKEICPICKGLNNHRIFLQALGGWVDCPNCKGVKKVAKDISEDVSIDLLEWLRIPDMYKGRFYERNAITEGKAKSLWDISSVTSTLDMMDNIYSSILNDEKTSSCIYFYTGGCIDTCEFVYGCQQVAVKKDLTAVPYISLNMLNDLQNDKVININKPMSEYYKVTYEDYIEADVCFLEASANVNNRGWIALADILNARASRGKSLYVMGYWGAESVINSGARFLLNMNDNRCNFVNLTVSEFQSRGKANTNKKNIAESINIPNTVNKNCIF